METTIIEAPALYGDHHVIEVRRILLEIPGVQDVYASSAFHFVEVTYDPQKVSKEAIEQKLAEYGYLEDWAFPAESGQPVTEDVLGPKFFRHTEVFENARQTVAFQQQVSYSGRPLWNCPGFGVIKNKMED